MRMDSPKSRTRRRIYRKKAIVPSIFSPMDLELPVCIVEDLDPLDKSLRWSHIGAADSLTGDDSSELTNSWRSLALEDTELAREEYDRDPLHHRRNLPPALPRRVKSSETIDLTHQVPSTLKSIPLSPVQEKGVSKRTYRQDASEDRRRQVKASLMAACLDE